MLYFKWMLHTYVNWLALHTGNMIITNVNLILANEQPRKDVRLQGSSLIKPCAKVSRQNESRSDVTLR